MTTPLHVFAEPAAPPPPFELQWSAPPECPDRAAVQGSIARHFGRAPGEDLGRGLRVELTARPQQGGLWGTTIAFHDGHGASVRELGDATDCTRAVDAAALVIAIAIDPARVFEPRPEVPPEPEPAADPEPVPEPAPTRPEESEPPVEPEPDADRRRGVAPQPPVATVTPRRPSALRGAIGIAAGPDFGELPRIGGLARLHGALLGRFWRVELGGTFAGAPARALDPGRITVLRWSVDARGCGVVPVGTRVELLPCGGLEIGRSHAQSEGLATPRRRADGWLAAVVAARVNVRLGQRFGLFAEGDLVVPMWRREYRIAGADVVHRVPVVTGALVAGVDVRFP